MPDPIYAYVPYDVTGSTISTLTNWRYHWNATATNSASNLVYGQTAQGVRLNAVAYGDSYYAWGHSQTTGYFDSRTNAADYRVAREHDDLHAHLAACRELDESEPGKRAFELLKEFVPEAKPERSGGFYVTSSEGSRFYIERGYPNGNVFRLGGECSCGPSCDFPCHQRAGIAPPCKPCGCALEGERKVARYCLHPKKPHPTDDTCLAQMLLLEEDENLFLRTANESLVR